MKFGETWFAYLRDLLSGIPDRDRDFYEWQLSRRAQNFQMENETNETSSTQQQEGEHNGNDNTQHAHDGYCEYD